MSENIDDAKALLDDIMKLCCKHGLTTKKLENVIKGLQDFLAESSFTKKRADVPESCEN